MCLHDSAPNHLEPTTVTETAARERHRYHGAAFTLSHRPPHFQPPHSLNALVASPLVSKVTTAYLPGCRITDSTA
jgi:hypothetical protein